MSTRRWIGHGAGTRSRGQGFVQQTTRCTREVPLGVEQGSKRELVGFIRVGTPFTITKCRPDLAMTTARDMGPMPYQARFFVETSRLASCTMHAPPSLGDAPPLARLSSVRSFGLGATCERPSPK
jgi:hypothetical protein